MATGPTPDRGETAPALEREFDGVGQAIADERHRVQEIALPGTVGSDEDGQAAECDCRLPDALVVADLDFTNSPDPFVEVDRLKLGPCID